MLPPSSIRKLSDHFGSYLIEVRCRRCQHERQIDPQALARVFGWDAELARVTPRLRCSRCQARDAEVQVAFVRRPRRWTPNPS
jgi:hypothetical protein